MCGRFAFFSPHEAVQEVFGVSFPAPLEARYNIAPTRFVFALRAGTDDALEPAVLKWGLVPSWAKDPAIGNRMINARAESVAEKTAYKDAFRRRRCLVVADGFYEWKRLESGKQPYFIYMADRSPFAFAGLWERWKPRGDQPFSECLRIVGRPRPPGKPRPAQRVGRLSYLQAT